MKNTNSILTKNQKKEFVKFYTEGGTRYRITANVRYDDQCGNGHNSFAITGNIERKARNGRWVDDCGGCIHKEIKKHFPELAPLIKWHLFNSNGPMYYIENTLYHALEHGATHAWVYYRGAAPSDPLGLGDDSTHQRLLGYLPAERARLAVDQVGYAVKWDAKTVKVRNLDYARSSAVWPEATDADLTQSPEALKSALLARLPALIEEFKNAVESLGFIF